jgi:hypothetical protein
LGHTDDGVEDENGENLHVRKKDVSDYGQTSFGSRKCLRESTYNGGINKSTPTAFVFEQGETKGNGGGAK